MNNVHPYKISVFGLGYVGCVTSSCLAYLKHNVIGVDISKEKIELINDAKAPIEEPLLADFLRFGIKHNYLSATNNIEYAIKSTDISFICVCTPPKEDGSCDLSYLLNLMKNFGKILAKKPQEHVIIIRSTIPPGTMQDHVIPALEKYSGKKNNQDFYTCFHPEFLREGTAINDFFNPPKYIIGENGHQHSGDRILELLLLHADQKNIIRTDFKTAELVKYTDNVWHALKVTFANEIGSIADSYGVNGYDLMDIFCKDKKLNISDYYMKPGLSYGGSCLPKDLESMQYLVRNKNLEVPIINSIANSNNKNIDRTCSFVNKHANGKLGWYGVSFKDKTDDLRNSVSLEILSKLVGNYDVKIYDSNLHFDKLIKEQEKLLTLKLGDFKKIHVDDFIRLIDGVDTLILGHNIELYRNALLRYPRPLTILDLANNNISSNDTHHNYHGLFW